MHSYDFVTENEIIENVDNASRAPINRLIDAVIQDGALVSWDFADRHQPAQMRDERVKDIALVVAVHPSQEIHDDDFDKAKRGAKELEDFYRRANHGYWDKVRVTPYVVKSDGSTGFGLFFQWHTVRDQMEEQHPGRYEQHTYFHGWGGAKSGILGHAYIGTDHAWTYTGGQRTVRHEQGHCFGNNHSRTDNNEYGDPTCVMAKARSGFNASQMLNMRQIDVEHEYEEIAQDGVYFLTPVECDPLLVRNNEYKILRVDNTHVLSARKTKNQNPMGVTERFYDDNPVFVHWAPGHKLQYPIYEGTIKPGQTKEIRGYQITHGGSHEGVAKVIVGDPNQDAAFPEPLNPVSDFPETSSLSAVWHDPQYEHQGFDLTFISDEDRMFGYWFTYHAKGEHRVSSVSDVHNGREWFLIDGKFNGDHFDVEIYHCAGREKRQVGHGTLAHRDGRLRLRCWTENYGRELWELSQLTPTKEQPGVYESGALEGYSVARYRDSWVAYWFGHDSYGRLDWAVYSGSEAEMIGYTLTSAYKASYAADREGLAPVSLSDLLEDTTQVASAA